MRLWLARIVSVSASQMLLVALGWQMYELTGSAWDLGLVGLAQFVPALLLTLPAGQWIDRHHRGRILAGCLAVQVASAAALAWGSAAGWMSREALLGVSAVLGALRAVQMPTQQALTPLLVPAAVLRNVTEAARTVFFQISTVPDAMGVLIGHDLHLTVRPHAWWLEQLFESCSSVLDIMESA